MYIGVAHNYIKCIDEGKNDVTSSDIFVTDNLWVDNNERGARKFDPKKYINDALKLKDQFFEVLYDDPHNLLRRSAFYTAQSYMDAGFFKEAIQWYTLFTQLKDTWNEEFFESVLRIGKCMIELKFDENQIKVQLEKAINIFPDRAEPYFVLGKYFNDKSNAKLGYHYLIEAKNKNLLEVSSKYGLFINKYNYGKYINDELSVSCFWTGRLIEGYKLLIEIIDDEEFQDQKERLLENKIYFLTKMKIIK